MCALQNVGVRLVSTRLKWVRVTLLLMLQSLLLTYRVAVGSAPSALMESISPSSSRDPRLACSGTTTQTLFFSRSPMVEWPPEVCQGRSPPLYLQKALEDTALLSALNFLLLSSPCPRHCVSQL